MYFKKLAATAVGFAPIGLRRMAKALERTKPVDFGITASNSGGAVAKELAGEPFDSSVNNPLEAQVYISDLFNRICKSTDWRGCKEKESQPSDFMSGEGLSSYRGTQSDRHQTFLKASDAIN